MTIFYSFYSTKSQKSRKLEEYLYFIIDNENVYGIVQERDREKNKNKKLLKYWKTLYLLTF